MITSEIEKCIYEIKNTRNNVAIVAPAGTGKTTIIRNIVENDQNKKYLILAPTGVAAENIGGRTYHSTLKMPFNILTDDEIRYINRPRDFLRGTDVLILEEISMIRADHFDAIEYIFRKSLNNDLFFGGVQVVLVGDPFQLKPIVKFEEDEYYKIFGDRYKGPYFFNSLCFKTDKFKWFQLTKIFRQEDPVFINNLNRIRIGDVDNTLVDYFNTRYEPFFNVAKDECVAICTSKIIRDIFNDKALKSLNGPVVSNCAIISGDISIDSIPAEKNLILKNNSKIMMVKNDADKRWVNGTIGNIVNINEDALDVKIKGQLHKVNKNKWSNIEYSYDKTSNNIIETEKGFIIQYPLVLGYAFTDKKVQGLTFNEIAIHTGRGLYDSGQAYNILSRCRSFEKIHLLTKLKRSDFIIDKSVIEFMKHIDAITVK